MAGWMTQEPKQSRLKKKSPWTLVWYLEKDVSRKKMTPRRILLIRNIFSRRRYSRGKS